MIRIKKILKRIKRNAYSRRIGKYIKRHNRNKNTTGLILFICQFESIWNKTKGVYLECKRRNLNAKLLVVKDRISFANKDTIFERTCIEDVIYYKPGIIDELKPSMVFYSRPYDDYLPNDLRSNNVVKKTKTAFIPYYYALEEEYDHSLDYYFIGNIYCLFADQEATKKYFDGLFKRNIKKQLQFSYSLGYPALESLIERINNSEVKESIYRNKGRINVMWTPRWTTSEALGGSNFLKYYKSMFEVMNNNSMYSFVFRPHPMLFDNFLKNNYISKNEYDEIINMITSSSNMFYDNTSDYFETFINTDILISDNSSIIIEYLLTGKPMIYCFNKSEFVFNKPMNDLLDVNYVVNNWEELKQCLDDLTRGNDYKRDKRLELVERLKKENVGACKKIVDVICNVI